ncbi:MAG TPA: protein kinase, partial [Gemmatimonadales bacterium]|nr:protein kinase [Gemmatimonadales bacterium]
RTVAIKILHPELAGAIGIDRFLREIRLTAQLQHPNIVPILDSGVLEAPEGRLPWYAMSFLEGESLRARLAREGQIGVEEALAITEAAAEALSAAHRQGIVHRDIKPENIFLSGGRVFVVDFGIAKALLGSEAEKLTSTGLAIGTPAYMSPEQGFGGQVDARTDQYSLATVLYEMLAGDPPFSGSTAQVIMARRLTEPARSMLPVRSTVPPAVESAVLRALERAPADRFSDIRSFASALRTATTGQLTTPRAGTRWRRRLVWALPIVGLALGGWWLATRTGASAGSGPDSVTVDLYRRGAREYAKRTPEGVLQALSLFSAAIERDSSYAPAWNGLAKAYIRAYQRSFAVPGVSPDRVLPQAVAAADRALVLDSSSADSWLTRGVLSWQVDPVDLAPMYRAITRALALDSTSAEAWHFLALYHAEQGDLARGMDLWRKTVRLGPAYTQGLVFLGIGHSWRGDYDSAAFWGDSTLAVESNYLLGRTHAGYMAIERGDYQRAEAMFEAARRLATEVEVTNVLAGSALALARSGRRGEARTLLRRVDSSLAAQQTPVTLHTVVFVAQAHAGLGNTTQALGLLQRYRPQGDRHYQLHLRCDPQFIPLRSLPAFRTLLVTPAPAGKAGC